MEPESHDRISTLARIGVTLCGVQIEATNIAARDVIRDPYVFGYCFGVFETMAQMAGLEQYSEGAKLMETALGELVENDAVGPHLFRVALGQRQEADFAAGAAAGEQDVEAWYADANAMPTGIARRLGRKA